MLLLLSFCFLPWITTHVDCGGSLCDGGARLQPTNLTGLTLATGGVTTHEVVARISIYGDDPSNMMSLPIPPLPESQLSLPLLWIFPIVSLLMMLISLTNLLSRGSRGPQGNLRNLLLGGTLLMTVLVELFYMGSLSSAFSETADALAHMTFQAPYDSAITLQLSTFPELGFWFAFLMTLMGSAFILWTWWEERPANLMYTLWHLESVSSSGNIIRRTYRLSPLNITRPRRGTSKTLLICPFCLQSFTLRVLSKQTLWLYRSLLAAGLIAFTLWLPLALFPSSDIPSIDLSGGSFVIIPMSLCLVFLMVLDGIRLGRFFDWSHFIRRGKRSRKEI